MATAPARPANNRIAPPSVLRRHGSQLGIIGVGVAMWLAFVFAAPAVFTNIDIYRAFAQTTPQFGIIALSLTFVVITGEIDLSFPSVMALGTAAFCLVTAFGGAPWWLGLPVALATGALCGFVNGCARRQAQHSLARHHDRHLLPLSRARTRADERHGRAADGGQISGDACAAALERVRRARADDLDGDHPLRALVAAQPHALWRACVSRRRQSDPARA